jgi:chorismate synthase
VVETNPFFWPDPGEVAESSRPSWTALRKSGDSVGARVTVVADGVPPGWGEPIYGKLDGDLAAALMSINAVKGVEIGDGLASRPARQRTPRPDDPDGFLSNHAGGILGGISSGQDKSSSVSRSSLPPEPASAGRQRERERRAGRHRHHRSPRSLRGHPRGADRRSDAGAGLLIDHALRHRAQCGDVSATSRRAFRAKPLFPETATS